jgi:hypothetical protein
MKGKFLIIVGAILLLASCGGSSFTYQKNPVDEIITQKSNLANYSITLNDMDYTEGSDSYKHQYKIIYQPSNNPDTLLLETTKWYNVSAEYFQKHVNDLGMALVTVKNYVVEKQVSPPGYSDYVGNEKYGRWENRGGHSFWHFYGQYMFMSHMFNMVSPVRRSYYDGYVGSRHYGTPYYGPTTNGRTMYGTNSTANSNTKWSSRSSTFKSRVRTKVKQSANRSSRSRYSSRSSTRSRTSTRRSYGGGFGK